MLAVNGLEVLCSEVDRCDVSGLVLHEYILDLNASKYKLKYMMTTYNCKNEGHSSQRDSHLGCKY